MRLVVFHYHDRPGGVRQVITRGLPLLLPRVGVVDEVMLLLGEMTDPGWVACLAASLEGVPLRLMVLVELGYLSDGPAVLGSETKHAVEELLATPDTLVWAHNLSVGRNLPLLCFLPDACARTGARLWLHHHDWWWDGRWARWKDWRHRGISGLEEALEYSLPTGPHISHWCVNQADLPWVQLRAGNAARWVGNPLPGVDSPALAEVRLAVNWLKEKTGGRRVWLAPVRALRRKNLAESLLLVLAQGDHDLCLLTTAGPSSQAEKPAWERLCGEAIRHGWPLVPGALDGGLWRDDSDARRHSSQPTTAALIAASEAVILTSLQEGFGLPWLEAAALGKPLISRAIPDLTANFAALGCSMPSAYERLPVQQGWFDASAESKRLRERRNQLAPLLPDEMSFSAADTLPEGGRDYGTLSLEAQLEGLRQVNQESFPLIHPRVPEWAADRRRERWAERFFESAHPGGVQTPSPGSLMPEVHRRFRYWLAHPLLWP